MIEAKMEKNTIYKYCTYVLTQVYWSYFWDKSCLRQVKPQREGDVRQLIQIYTLYII